MNKCDPAANVKLEEPIDSPRKKASEIQQMEGVNKYYTRGRLESREVKEEWEHRRSGKMLQREGRHDGCKNQNTVPSVEYKQSNSNWSRIQGIYP